MKLRPKNWERFQHYRDRLPPWIKLHRDLLNDRDVMMLDAGTRGVLMMCWLLACERSDGSFDGRPSTVAWRLRMKESEAKAALDELVSAGLLIESAQTCAADERDDETPAQSVARRNGFGSRYISPQTRVAVTARDKDRCCACEATSGLEFDHIVPVSAGGSSTEGNVWLLCRRCNRSKRTKTVEEFIAAQDATQAARVCAALERAQSAYSETEREAETEEREIRAAVAAAPRHPKSDQPTRPEDVPEQTWADWLTHRKAKRAAVTKTALEGIRREAAKAGMSLADALAHSIAQGWQGFRADWVKRDARFASQPQRNVTTAMRHVRNVPIGFPTCHCSECVQHRERQAQ